MIDYSLSLPIIALAIAILPIIRRLFTKTPPFPPGPPRSPIVGNLFQIPVDKPWVKFADWGKIYGDIVYLRVFGRNMLVLNSLEASVDLFEKRSAIYSDRPRRVMGQLSGFGRLLLFSKYDHGVREARRLMHSQLSARAAAAHQHLQEQAAYEFARDNLEHPEKFPENIRKAAASVILMISYGHKVNSDDDQLLGLAKEVMQHLARSVTPNTYLVDAVPFLRFLPKWFPGAGFQTEAQKCRGILKVFMDEPYDNLVMQMKDGTALPSYAHSVMQKKGGVLTEEEVELIKWTAGDMFGAGSDTTIGTLENFFLAMTLNPDVQKKAQAEIDAIVGSGRLPGFADRAALTYVNCIIQEIWRWNPVVPFAGHSLRVDDVYRGYLIPAGTVVMANNWALTHNEEWYPEPLKFKPERHLPSDDPSVTLPPDPRTLAFGFGRRSCPGLHLAENLVYIAVVSTLAAFSISPQLDEAGNPIFPLVDHTSGAISHPKPFKCRIVPRSPSAAELLINATSN